MGLVWFVECEWVWFGLVCKYTKSGEGRGKDEDEEGEINLLSP